MKQYKQFIDNLKGTLERRESIKNEEWNKEASKFINGMASDELRTLVSLEDRRKSGAFFTSASMAAKVLQSYKLTFEKKATFYDPACGAGDLLISAKDYCFHELKNKEMGVNVVGSDIHEEFVEVARLRLLMYDHCKTAVHKQDYSNNISLLDGLKDNSFYKNATHIFTNPPFNQIDSINIDWASGKVCAAALFIDSIIQNVKPKTQIIAILPDVLRSGSRYEKWRKYVTSNCDLSGVKMLGQFDKYADVDVFSVLLIKKELPLNSGFSFWNTSKKHHTVVSDLFTVNVGPVVDNRDPNEGPLRPYLVSRGLKGWSQISQNEKSRRYKGKFYESPFVVIKRTSRHGDKHRAIGTLITIPEPVYIDNHLIVLKPLSGSIADCKRLLKKLKSETTNKWINKQIRCRHLTVQIVTKIPL